MSSTSIDVASQALARLGEPSIGSFSEDSDAAEKVKALYEPTVLQLLGSHNWSFARRRAQLKEDGAISVVNEWQRAFLMPALQTERVGKPLAVFNTTALRASKSFEFDIEGRWIKTNYDVIVIEYTARLPESQWPGYFHTLAIEALAATLALPVTENASKEEHHRRVAYGSPSEGGRGGLFRTATGADASGDPTISLLDDSNPLSEARFGGRF